MDGLRSSPMLDQYRRIKKEHSGSILFFRLGDFYEMFADDAVEVSSLLNLTLTSRNGLPMCGVPYHAARSYIARLLKVGKKIAVCEQFTAQEKQKLIDREVIEIITPGTTVDEDFLDKGSSNYLCCLAAAGNTLSFSYIDLSTGGFFTTGFNKDEPEILRQELERLQIKEMLVQESLLEEEKQLAAAVYDRSGIVINRWADWLFDPVRARERLEKQFGLANLKSFGLDERSVEIISAGTLLEYLDSTAKKLPLHIRTLKVYRESEYLGIDESSQRNLELLANQRDGDVRFSLLEVMDETRCSMGRRLLKRRLLHPLRDRNKINARLDIVENFYRDQGKLSKLRDLLGKTPDLERLCSSLAMDKAHGRDMLAIKNALVSFHDIVRLINESFKNMYFENDDNRDITACDDLIQIQNLLDRGICDEPSILLNEGNLIKNGYSEELDSLKLLKDKGRQFLEEYLEEERQTTGITSLKIKYNRLIGYFFEVTNTHLTRVPKHFIRRQGTAGGERYTTDKLASLESEINGASDKIIELEKKLFLEIREQAKKTLPHLCAAACRMAELDAAQSLAKAASVRNWTRPVLNESTNMEIREGRHPVVEAHLGRGEYIPNDIVLNTDKKDGISFVMITGPNMAGKSTYLRSAALITIMAQSGSFVPASEANIGLCDRIYCRVGASDNLARGESTFLVEMNETAFILNTATEKSLVIMDEVGRGTGTNDGLSIAWAVSEELLNRIKCRTLFATHFHELSLLSHQNLANRSMEVLDKDGMIVFLRKLKEGPAAESYGIHAAKLAGLNDTVLERASQIMELLKERDSELTETFYNEKIFKQDGIVNRKNSAVINEKTPDKPSAGFPAVQSKIENLLHEIEPEQMTPLEALNILCQWKKIISAGNNESEKVPEKKQKQKSSNKETDNFPSLFD